MEIIGYGACKLLTFLEYRGIFLETRILAWIYGKE